MSQSPYFEPLEAMDLRSRPGTILDKVDLNQQRFVVRRKGKPKALIVPLSDGVNIQLSQANQAQRLNKTYAAFHAVQGIIDDPTLTHASETIDEWLYGKAQSKEA